MNKIMKKISLFALICAGVFGFAVSSCSSDDKDVTVAGVNPETPLQITFQMSMTRRALFTLIIFLPIRILMVRMGTGITFFQKQFWMVTALLL